ncbi:hypothetical protein CARUB_v10007868mg [Capsella rubella]|uniref:Uncharacterized protein n=1 Tax=Capsella rubella TaxID=81985 RepID=R0GQM2_9BRAS|nr:hypothetical protein CARUB_v10007868mg [Capsella rubella]
MHIHKWWDDAVMEEIQGQDRLVQVLAYQVDSLNSLTDRQTEEKVILLEKMLGQLVKKKHRFGLVIGVMTVGCCLLLLSILVL